MALSIILPWQTWWNAVRPWEIFIPFDHNRKNEPEQQCSGFAFSYIILCVPAGFIGLFPEIIHHELRCFHADTGKRRNGRGNKCTAADG